MEVGRRRRNHLSACRRLEGVWFSLLSLLLGRPRAVATAAIHHRLPLAFKWLEFGLGPLSLSLFNFGSLVLQIV